MKIRRTLIFILCLIVSSACSGVKITQDLQVERKYKRDLSLSVNGISAKGYLVSKKDQSYKISIKAPDQMDALLIQTCHREILVEGAGREYSFTYVPVQGLEDEGSCPMYLSGITKKKERIALGFVEFYSGQTLEAKINCSGSEIASQGVSICQAPVSLWQEITFGEEVKFIEPEGKCAMQAKSDGRKIKYRMPNADCVVLFKGVSGRYHKANLLGFEDYVLKE